jgi:hypothetical protein
MIMLSRISLMAAASVGIASLTTSSKGVAAFVLAPVPSISSASITTTSLFHAPAPKHDVSAGNNAMANLTPEQIQRVQAYMEHQQNAPKIGFPTDVRSLIQYNHGFAVMGTNSKS